MYLHPSQLIQKNHKNIKIRWYSSREKSSLTIQKCWKGIVVRKTTEPTLRPKRREREEVRRKKQREEEIEQQWLQQEKEKEEQRQAEEEEQKEK